MSTVPLKIEVDDEQFRAFEERVRRVREDLECIKTLSGVEVAVVTKQEEDAT